MGRLWTLKAFLDSWPSGNKVVCHSKIYRQVMLSHLGLKTKLRIDSMEPSETMYALWWTSWKSQTKVLIMKWVSSPPIFWTTCTKLKTVTITLIVEFRFLNDEIRDTIFGMKFKIDRDALSERIQQKKSLYQRLKCLILKTFNGFRRQVRVTTP